MSVVLIPWDSLAQTSDEPANFLFFFLFFFHLLGVKWVCGDIGQVSLDVFNPMPFELKASNMVSFCGLY